MSYVTFVQPAFLLLLLLLAPIWVLGVAAWRMPQSARRRAGWRAWGALLLRSCLVVALALALAGAQIVRAAPNMATVFILDSSDSVSPTARAAGERYIAAALQKMPASDRASIVAFGADAQVERPPSSEKQFARLRTTPDGSATDIARALRLGLATLPADSGRRVILLSDGGENRQSEGGALDIAAEARAEGIPIETVALSGPPAADDIAVETIEAPATAREGQTVRLVVQARLPRATGGGTTKARLRLLRDRQPILETEVQLQPGANRLQLTAVAPRGFHTWEARIDAPGDTVGANNVAFGFTEVRGAPRVLIVEGAPGRGINLQAALRSARIAAETIAPGALPQTLQGLDAWDTVVLADVPYRQLPPAAAKLLPAYVRELGHGLLMVGGEDSYAAGGYGNTPVEDALPVRMRVKGAQVQPDVAIVMVIDHSGSMSGKKLDLAKEGIAQAFSTLEPNDQVGVIAFDTTADWVVNLQRKPSADAFLGAVGGIGVGGGTNLRPGLEQAADALERTQAKIKHVVMLTDGQAARNYDDVVDRLKRDRITLSTVGVGDGYDPHLKDIAPITGGRFYEALNFEDLPRLFFDETIRVARRGIVEETFTPRLGSASAATRDLRQAPPLYGYNAVTARDTAQVSLTGPNGDPILAEWQYGLGRAAAWTSDMKGQWARDWVQWSGFGRFAGQLVEALVTRPIGAGYELNASVTGAALALDLRADTAVQGTSGATAAPATARLVAPDGKVTEVPLVERQPGRYRGTVPLPDPGVYRVQALASSGGTESLVATTGAVVPPSAEYLQRDGNPGLLKAIAETSGGHPDFPPGSAFARPATVARRAAPIIWPLLWLAALLWPLDIALRRVFVRGVSLPALARRAVGQRRDSGAAGSLGGQSLRRAEAVFRSRRGGDSAAGGAALPATGAAAASERNAPAPGGASAAPRPAPPVRPSWRDTRRTVVERPGERKGPPGG